MGLVMSWASYDVIVCNNVGNYLIVWHSVEIPAADPGFLGGLITIFTSGGGYWRGRAPPVTARGAGGAL